MTLRFASQFASQSAARLLRAIPVCALDAAAAASAPAQAQPGYPDHPIRFVVPMPPAGGTDTISRCLTQRITAKYNYAFVVENRPGAAGNIGMDSVAKSAPDGYTFAMGQSANLVLSPWLYSTLPFNPLKDFSLVALVSAQPVILVVRQDSPYKSLQDLIQDGKRNPGKLKMGHPGPGTTGHLSGELLARQAGVEILSVAYKGASPALTDLIGGQTDFYFSSPPAVLQLIKGGKLRALAVTSSKRLGALPNVPTVAEQGYKGFESVVWYGVVAPAKTPKNVIEDLNRKVNDVLKEPGVIATLNAEGSVPLGGSTAQFESFLQSEHAKWGALVKAANIKLD
ncbi:MAG: tripartite tricarboxylate transporter substrate binding protein [Candidatus Protistobacter heckmanni]|nr:tripartite tricarboxylate transporter substrate binding protein [Candidatus Protistobacter heckmanni]